MENGSEKWNFQGNKGLNASAISVRGVYNMLMDSISNNENNNNKPLVRLCRVDPTDNPLFRTAPVATDAVATAANSFNFYGYPPTAGLPDAKRAIANYLSSDLPYQLSPDNVSLTLGGTQAIDIILPALARPGANILLSRPGYPQYDARAACCLLEVRYFDLLPERGWEVDLDSLEAVADENTVAMVIINPSNPCGNVFTSQHLKKVAETARKLGICVISDEVYGHVAYGNNPFVPMGVFAPIVPVITIGSLSKRWLVPGWRVGWIATMDPNGIFQKTGIKTNIISYLEITSDPPTFMQAAIPQILERTDDDFHLKNLNIMREAANKFYDVCKEIPCLTCPHKPEGAMAAFVKINFSQVKDIVDDVDFCVKLAKEESVLLLPGVTVGLKNWLRISLAVDLSELEEGLSRIKAFSLRAIANYLSSDLPYQLSPDNVFLTVGGTQAIDIILHVLARPGANILLPRPGYPLYDAHAACCLLEVRYFDLSPERGWEVDLHSLEALADENTVAMVIINPSNPCGNVCTLQHLKKVAETARKLGICVISDEVYAHVAFGSNPFVPMGVFASIVPVITIGSLSKRWLVPGWRIGWIATMDPHEIFQKTGIKTNIISYLEITSDPPTFMQAAIPQILERTNDDFHFKNLNMMREAANIFYDVCKEIPCLTCPHKPEGAMAAMVKINFSKVKDIVDDLDFCVKLAKEESVILLPGVTVGLKNWLRISLAVDPSDLEEGLSRMKAFSLRYAKMS